jgi:hypothetical protein
MSTRYAAAVIHVLIEDFGPELRDPVIEKIVRDAIVRQAQSAEPSFEVIIDNPISASWRLKPTSKDRRRVRLACYRMHPTDSDRERERRINTALAAIPEG